VPSADVQLRTIKQDKSDSQPNDYASVMSSLCHINAANADDDPAEAIIELERRPL